MLRPCRSLIGLKTTFAAKPSPPRRWPGTCEPAAPGPELTCSFSPIFRVLAPDRQPLFEQLLGHFGLHQVLELRGAGTHRRFAVRPEDA